MILTLP